MLLRPDWGSLCAIMDLPGMAPGQAVKQSTQNALHLRSDTGSKSTATRGTTPLCTGRGAAMATRWALDDGGMEGHRGHCWN